MCIFTSCQCTDYARASYMYIAGAGEVRVARVAFAVREAVCSIQAMMTLRAVIPDLHLHHIAKEAIVHDQYLSWRI